MGRDRAAYMRDYRARRKDARIRYGNGDGADEIAKLQGALAAANDEIARLKRELAAKPSLGTFNSRPFTPVPKKGK
jgi:predicted  nucleic acid-binding Zn-ribbon protein